MFQIHYNMTYHYNHNLRELSKKLRNESTQSEILLWQHIKGQVLGVAFNRQFPIENYIIDFYCKELKLAVEIDGMSHDNAESQIKDEERQHRLESYGIKFVRLDDREVMYDIENSLRTIKEAINDLRTVTKHPPTPLYKGENSRYQEILKQ